jgi:hypothetical protein
MVEGGDVVAAPCSTVVLRTYRKGMAGLECRPQRWCRNDPIAVGSIVAADVGDVPITDGRSTPTIAYAERADEPLRSLSNGGPVTVDEARRERWWRRHETA